MLPRQSTVSQMNHLFKVPSSDGLPVKKATVESIKTPRNRVQMGRMKNELKPMQQSKISLIPRPSFINSRKSLHGLRSGQLNARRELIKKMVFLAECTLRENNQIKKSTPVKMIAGLNPKKTPRSGGEYFVLPELKKKTPKLEEVRSPIIGLVRKEMFSYSSRPSPFLEKINEVNRLKSSEEDSCNFTVKPEESANKTNNSETRAKIAAILCHFKVYSAKINLIHDNLKVLDDSFERTIKDLPDYKIYNDFRSYQCEKEKLYEKIQTLETDLKNYVATQTNVGNKLNAYVQRKREFFERQTKLSKDFERAVCDALEKCPKNEEEEKPKAEGALKPRRSLRLSKIRKAKSDDLNSPVTPMTRKLKKLNSRSIKIQKSVKIRSP